MKVFNATTGVLIDTMTPAGSWKFTGQLLAAAPFTSVTVQSADGGRATVPVTQK